MTMSEMRQMGREKLRQAGIDSYSLDSDVLLMAAADVDRTSLMIDGQTVLPEAVYKKYIEYLELRTKNMPVQLILGQAEFMSLDFYVNKHTLIPRPDTEILVETVIAREKFNQRESNIGFEIGTGSGCISISLAHYLPKLHITAIDICPHAIDAAQINAAKHGVHNRAAFLRADIFSDFPAIPYSFIVSNPPYIPTDDIKDLAPNVRDYEPTGALDGGADGLDFYRRIAEISRKMLAKYGRIYLEIGHDQAQDVCEILANVGFVEIKTLKDLANHDRVICAIKGE